MDPEVSAEAQQTLHFVNQVEPMVAAGPHGKLDEYLSVVDLLFNAQALFDRTKYVVGLELVDSLLATSMNDLEYEFKDMLQRRSVQAAGRLTRDQLKELRPDRIGGTGSGSFESMPKSSVGSGAGSPKPASPELAPPATVRWLQQIAQRMRLGGQAAFCAEAYRAVRSGVLQGVLDKLEVQSFAARAIQDMQWAELEQTIKEWIVQMNIVVGVLLGAEYDLCKRVLEGLGREQGRAFAELIRGTAVAAVSELLRMGREIAAKRLPEQLFAVLDMFSTVSELEEEAELVFRGPGNGTVLEEFKQLQPLLANAVAATFDQIKRLLEEPPSAPDASSRRRLFREELQVGVALMLDSKRLKDQKDFLNWLEGKRFNLLTIDGSFSKSAPDGQDDLYDQVPRGGDVHLITRYIVNYIRGYLQRLGKRTYLSTLEKVFHVLSQGDGDMPRSIDRETAQLVLALRNGLDSKAKLYKDDCLKELFLMNNVNYLYRSMHLWDGWHGRGLQRAVAHAKRNNWSDVQQALADLQDDRIVTNYGVNFQNFALGKVLSIIHDIPTEPRSGRRFIRPDSSLSDLKSRVKRFNVAFDELVARQKGWVIPDQELRNKVRAKWVIMLKEHYQRMLQPHWEEIKTSKVCTYSPEDIEAHIGNFFGSAGS